MDDEKVVKDKTWQTVGMNLLKDSEMKVIRC